MPESTEKATTRQAALNAASAAASKRLKEAHLEEWNGYMVEEAKARKEKWAPKPTAEERAAAEFKALLEAHPHLAEQFASKAD